MISLFSTAYCIPTEPSNFYTAMPKNQGAMLLLNFASTFYGNYDFTENLRLHIMPWTPAPFESEQ